MIEAVGGAGRTESELTRGASFSLNVDVHQGIPNEAQKDEAPSDLCCLPRCSGLTVRK